ncbi:MAG TPA: hypothetical protein VLE97_00455, partial [Gaiellaceae bacterium]|nr:hypothetical protein [Gaiellaceae bacterium]
LEEWEAELNRRTAGVARASGTPRSGESIDAALSRLAGAAQRRESFEQPGAWNVNVLERLVVSASTKAPERAEEWRAYVFYLRDFADEKGRLPRSFDGLVADVFGDVANT